MARSKVFQAKIDNDRKKRIFYDAVAEEILSFLGLSEAVDWVGVGVMDSGVVINRERLSSLLRNAAGDPMSGIRLADKLDAIGEAGTPGSW